MRITPRSGWNARPPKRPTVKIALPSPRLYLHHTAGALDAGNNGVWWDDMRGIQNYHLTKWNDIAYSFVIGGGHVFEARGAGIAGSHTSGQNTKAHAICVVGDYTWMDPTAHDVKAIVDLVVYGHREGWWPNRITGGHRSAPGAQTSCPGDKLNRLIPEINQRVALQLTGSQEDDLTDDEAKMLSRIHHEVVVGVKGDRPDTVAQMLERLLDRVEAIEKKLA